METYQLNSLETKLVNRLVAHAARYLEDGEYSDYDDDVVDDFVYESENLHPKGERLLTVNEEEVLKVINEKVSALYLASVENNLKYLLSNLKGMALNINGQLEDRMSDHLSEIARISQEEEAKKKRDELEERFLNSLSPVQKIMHQELSK